MSDLSIGTKVGLAVSGSLVGVWAVTPASAADYRRVAPPAPAYVAPSTFDPWNAFSIGIGAVGNVALTPTSTDVDHAYFPYVDLESDQTLAKANVGFTAEIGKDFHAAGSPFVLGIYGDYNLSNLTATSSAYAGDTGEWAQSDPSFKLKDGASVIGRAGWLANNTTLIYGLVGYTWERYTAQQRTSTNYGSSTDSKSGTIGGLTLGFGGEVMLSNWLSLKGEYRFTKLGGVSSFGGNYDFSTESYNTQSHGKTDLHQVRVVLSAKF